jgi:hypothetical protein
MQTGENKQKERVRKKYRRIAEGESIKKIFGGEGSGYRFLTKS